MHTWMLKGIPEVQMLRLGGALASTCQPNGRRQVAGREETGHGSF